MADKIGELRELFRAVHKEHQYSKRGKLDKVTAELERAGFKIEHAWGVYLHMPDGQVITLDDWNEELDK